MRSVYPPRMETASASQNGMSHDPPIRVLIVDAHASLQRLVTCVLDQPDSGVVVVGTVRDVDTALHGAASHHPQVIILSLRLPSAGGLAALRRLRGALPRTGIIALTELDHRVYGGAARAAGADAAVSTLELVTDLVPVVQRVAGTVGEAGPDGKDAC